jgi:hypothetical protein
MLFVSE